MSDTSVDATQRDPAVPLEPDKSLSELVRDLTRDFGDLVETHVQLAKTELKEELSRAGKGAGMAAAGGVGALVAVLLLSFAAAWGLDEVMPTGLAFLIVGAVWAVVALVLVQRGRREMQTVQAMPRTKASLKEDATWAHQQKI